MDIKEIQRVLNESHRRAKEHSLRESDIRDLRAALANMPPMEANPVERSAARNAQILDTQLRDLADRLEGDVLDESTFRALPDYLQRRIAARLENIVKRSETAAHKEHVEPEYASSVFKCYSDYKKCKASGSRYVCGLLFATCVLSQIVSIKLSGGA